MVVLGGGAVSYERGTPVPSFMLLLTPDVPPDGMHVPRSALGAIDPQGFGIRGSGFGVGSFGVRGAGLLLCRARSIAPEKRNLVSQKVSINWF